MTNYTPDHLTNLLTTDRENLTRICAEVCYGWSLEDLHPTSYFRGWYGNKAFVMDVRAFNPLENTEKGRSQAFELMFKFKLAVDVENESVMGPGWAGDCVSVHGEVTQGSIVIAAILTAQQENNDE